MVYGEKMFEPVLDIPNLASFSRVGLRDEIKLTVRTIGRLSDLPRDRDVVAYCRGPYCVLAVQAVEILRSRGFSAFRLEESVDDWRAEGLPVTAGEEK